jgi:hypothetical protein
VIFAFRHHLARNLKAEYRRCPGRRVVASCALRDIGTVYAGVFDLDEDVVVAVHGQGALCKLHDFSAAEVGEVDEAHG